MPDESTIRTVVITQVAHPEPPLLFCGGLHQPLGLRSIVEIRCDDGLVGIAETYGDDRFADLLRTVARRLVGHDIGDLDSLPAIVDSALAGRPALAGFGAPGAPSVAQTRRAALAPFEVACLDAHGRLTGRSVADLLGGRRRDDVPFAGYLFYRWDRHPGGSVDEWGAALDPEGVVSQARRMVARHGFGSLKLKGGVFPPDQEIAAVEALRAAFPGHPLRLDPNAAWTPATAADVARRLTGLVEYLEDPTDGMAAMAQVARSSPVPLATNMCVVAREDIPEATRLGAVRIVLGDLHYWGGLRASLALAEQCRQVGLGMSMHSSAHLGVSLAAMVQLGAALPAVDFAFDTHWPWQTEDLLCPPGLALRNGVARVPTGPGLGVDLDRDALARMHERYVRSGMTGHDHRGYLSRLQPGFTPNLGRW